MITHIVIFRTKCDEHKQILFDAAKTLGSIKDVHSFVCGTPIESERPIVDDTFAVALDVKFKTPDDMAAYAIHPIHLEFNKILAKYKVKTQIFDIAH